MKSGVRQNVKMSNQTDYQGKRILCQSYNRHHLPKFIQKSSGLTQPSTVDPMTDVSKVILLFLIKDIKR